MLKPNQTLLDRTVKYDNCFMSKVNPNNRNETKSDIFSRDILKSDMIFHWS